MLLDCNIQDLPYMLEKDFSYVYKWKISLHPKTTFLLPIAMLRMLPF